MLEFYKAVDSDNRNFKDIAVTVLEQDDKFFGEKILLSDNEVLWQSKEMNFLPSSFAGVNSSGIYKIDGKEVFCEILGNEKKIIICGGGHISIPIIKIGNMTGFKTYVLEDRPEFADNAKKAGALQVICEPFDKGLQMIYSDKDTFFVIVTRGHRYDQVCLEGIIKKEHAYIGMIGSKTKVAKTKEAMIEKGFSTDSVNSIYSPIGLNIGAKTPEEIAVAIMAQIIEVKNRENLDICYPKEIIRSILNNEGAKVLATIVMRRGSAPRETGAKMLVLSDGSCIGTIGGGIAESNIVKQAIVMLQNKEKKEKTVKLCHVDMTKDSSEDEGMVCGGVIDVLLELIQD